MIPSIDPKAYHPYKALVNTFNLLNEFKAFPSLGSGSAPAPGGAWTNTAAGLKRIKSSETSISLQILQAERRLVTQLE